MRSGAVLDDGDGGGGRVVDGHAEAAVLRVDGREGEVAHAGRAGARAGGPGRAPRYPVLQRHAPPALLLRGTLPVSALLHAPTLPLAMVWSCLSTAPGSCTPRSRPRCIPYIKP